jgi:hypothetical protein
MGEAAHAVALVEHQPFGLGEFLLERPSGAG